MKAVIQRVKKAQVWVENKIISEIGPGIVVLCCVEKGDDDKVLDWMAEKLVSLRIFPDEEGKFNKSLKDVDGEILLVSNFTICGCLKKGTRPSFHLAEEPRRAENLLKILAKKIEEKGIKVKEGVFGGYMEVFLTNDGPVTLILQRSPTNHLHTS